MSIEVNENTKFYMQRIAHQGEISFNLLEAGFLIYGWRDMMQCAYENNIDITYPLNGDDLEKLYEIKYGKGKPSRNRWNVWRFFNYSIGDYILVPKYKSFGIYKVIDTAKSIFQCEYIDKIIEDKTYDKEKIYFDKNKGLFSGSENFYDIGIVCKVERLYDYIDKKYAEAKLESKFKYQGANIDLTESKNEILKCIDNYENNKTVSLYSAIIEKITNENSEYYNYLKPDNLEVLMKNYFITIGATSVDIPSKNDSRKEDYADCDVEAIFENLKIRIIVQCKHHEGIENDETWAVEQITKYKE